MKQPATASQLLIAVTGLLLAATLGACAADLGEATDDEDVWTVADPGRAPAAQQAGPIEDQGVPGEDEAAILAGCTHIQWCNEPGPVGTVCIWDACSFSAALAECTSDANFVCGGITQPAEIR